MASAGISRSWETSSCAAASTRKPRTSTSGPRSFSARNAAPIPATRLDTRWSSPRPPTGAVTSRKRSRFWEKQESALGPLDPDGAQAATLYDDLGQVLAELGETAEAEAQLRQPSPCGGHVPLASSKTAESSHNLGILLWKTRRLTEAEAELRHAIEDLEAPADPVGWHRGSTLPVRGRICGLLPGLSAASHGARTRGGRLPHSRTVVAREASCERSLNGISGLQGEVPAHLERERRSTNAEYDRTQRELGELKPATQSKEIDEVLGRLSDLRRTQTEIAEAIGKASPRYGALRYPRAGDVAAAKAALDPGTLLLSYSVGRGLRPASLRTGSRRSPGRAWPLGVCVAGRREDAPRIRRCVSTPDSPGGAGAGACPAAAGRSMTRCSSPPSRSLHATIEFSSFPTARCTNFPGRRCRGRRRVGIPGTSSSGSRSPPPSPPRFIRS